jgi:hypothetical protein
MGFFLMLWSHLERFGVLLHQIQDDVQQCTAVTFIV